MKSIESLQPLTARERDIYEAGIQVGVEHATKWQHLHEGSHPLVSALFRDFAAELPTQAAKRLG